ncbi:MAG: hypothetical protein IKP65_08780 [Alphaproteobacteria bacterium]|nr:hypothetical protein [Alphaproteobacteria bacterium]
MERIAIVLRTKKELNELEVIKTGNEVECEAYLFNKLMPNSMTRNLQTMDCDNGYMYSVEKMEAGQWKEYKYLLMFGEKQN